MASRSCLEGKNWWPEEEMVLRAERARKADVLVTQAGPTWLRPPKRNGGLDHYLSVEAMSGWGQPGRNLETELQDELERNDRLFELVQPKQWYLGHYHHSATHQRNGCEIRQLDCGEFILHRPA